MTQARYRAKRNHRIDRDFGGTVGMSEAVPEPFAQNCVRMRAALFSLKLAGGDFIERSLAHYIISLTTYRRQAHCPARR